MASSLEECLLHCSSTANPKEKAVHGFKVFIVERQREGANREVEACHGYMEKSRCRKKQDKVRNAGVEMKEERERRRLECARSSQC